MCDYGRWCDNLWSAYIYLMLTVWQKSFILKMYFYPYYQVLLLQNHSFLILSKSPHPHLKIWTSNKCLFPGIYNCWLYRCFSLLTLFYFLKIVRNKFSSESGYNVHCWCLKGLSYNHCYQVNKQSELQYNVIVIPGPYLYIIWTLEWQFLHC